MVFVWRSLCGVWREGCPSCNLRAVFFVLFHVPIAFSRRRGCRADIVKVLGISEVGKDGEHLSLVSIVFSSASCGFRKVGQIGSYISSPLYYQV